MTSLLAGIDLVASLVLAPFFLFMFLIVGAATIGRFLPNQVRPGSRRSKFLIVIPAHNESGVIGETVRSCQRLDYDPALFSIFVIADNCTDSTASDALEAGARVVERFDTELRSKGHALEYFFTRIAEGRVDAGHNAVVLIDADTLVDPHLLSVFDQTLNEGKDWVQGYYSVSNPDASWRTRMMTYAFSLANGVWMVGLDRLGLSVGLKGNGMCFSTRGLERFPWKAYGLVEDMEFAWMLRVHGERVRFEPTARVFGQMVSRGGAGAASQRQRWEAGRNSLRAKFSTAVARSPRIGLLSKAGYLLDLYFPSLAWLALGLVAVSSLHLIRLWASQTTQLLAILLGIHASMFGILAVYALSPPLVMRLPARYLLSLLAFPYYVAWKLLIGAGRRPQSWIRTPREPQPPN